MKRNDLRTTAEAADYLDLSPRTLERYRVTGEGPRFIKLGRRVRTSASVHPSRPPSSLSDASSAWGLRPRGGQWHSLT